MNPVTDEEFVSQIAEYVASNPQKVAEGDPSVTEDFLAMAKRKGYEDSGRLKRFLLTPGGMAFTEERLRLARETKVLPAKFQALAAKEKQRVNNEFREITGREPTLAEREELYSEELKLKRGVKV